MPLVNMGTSTALDSAKNKTTETRAALSTAAPQRDLSPNSAAGAVDIDIRQLMEKAKSQGIEALTQMEVVALQKVAGNQYVEALVADSKKRNQKQGKVSLFGRFINWVKDIFTGKEEKQKRANAEAEVKSKRETLQRNAEAKAAGAMEVSPTMVLQDLTSEQTLPKERAEPNAATSMGSETPAPAIKQPIGPGSKIIPLFEGAMLDTSKSDLTMVKEGESEKVTGSNVRLLLSPMGTDQVQDGMVQDFSMVGSSSVSGFVEKKFQMMMNKDNLTINKLSIQKGSDGSNLQGEDISFSSEMLGLADVKLERASIDAAGIHASADSVDINMGAGGFLALKQSRIEINGNSRKISGSLHLQTMPGFQTDPKEVVIHYDGSQWSMDRIHLSGSFNKGSISAESVGVDGKFARFDANKVAFTEKIFGKEVKSQLQGFSIDKEGIDFSESAINQADTSEIMVNSFFGLTNGAGTYRGRVGNFSKRLEGSIKVTDEINSNPAQLTARGELTMNQLSLDDTWTVGSFDLSGVRFDGKISDNDLTITKSSFDPIRGSIYIREGSITIKAFVEASNLSLDNKGRIDNKGNLHLDVQDEKLSASMHKKLKSNEHFEIYDAKLSVQPGSGAGMITGEGNIILTGVPISKGSSAWSNLYKIKSAEEEGDELKFEISGDEIRSTEFDSMELDGKIFKLTISSPTLEGDKLIKNSKVDFELKEEEEKEEEEDETGGDESSGDAFTSVGKMLRAAYEISPVKPGLGPKITIDDRFRFENFSLGLTDKISFNSDWFSASINIPERSGTIGASFSIPESLEKDFFTLPIHIPLPPPVTFMYVDISFRAYGGLKIGLEGSLSRAKDEKSKENYWKANAKAEAEAKIGFGVFAGMGIGVPGVAGASVGVEGGLEARLDGSLEAGLGFTYTKGQGLKSVGKYTIGYDLGGQLMAKLSLVVKANLFFYEGRLVNLRLGQWSLGGVSLDATAEKEGANPWAHNFEVEGWIGKEKVSDLFKGTTVEDEKETDRKLLEVGEIINSGEKRKEIMESTKEIISEYDGNLKTAEKQADEIEQTIVKLNDKLINIVKPAEDLIWKHENRIDSLREFKKKQDKDLIMPPDEKRKELNDFYTTDQTIRDLKGLEARNKDVTKRRLWTSLKSDVGYGGLIEHEMERKEFYQKNYVDIVAKKTPLMDNIDDKRRRNLDKKDEIKLRIEKVTSILAVMKSEKSKEALEKGNEVEVFNAIREGIALKNSYDTQLKNLLDLQQNAEIRKDLASKDQEANKIGKDVAKMVKS